MVSDVDNSGGAYRAGFIGLVGLPNAGKSSFMNHILKEKVSIVSAKPQATRRRMTGILSRPKSQLIFYDGPGYLGKGRNAMTKYIASEAQEVIKDSEALLFLIACDEKPGSEIEDLMVHVKARNVPFGICITKLDQKPSKGMMVYLKKLRESEVPLFEFSTVNPKNESLEEIFDYFESVLPETPGPLYDPDLYTNENLRDLVAEFVREPCFDLLGQEIPFGLGVRIQKFDEQATITRIEATLLVEKENHKAIVVGKGGSMLKQIGQSARIKIEELLGQKVFLGLHVAHKESWTKKDVFMKELGYGKPS